MNKGFRWIFANTGGNLLALLFSLVAVLASFLVDEPEAYVFPRLVSALMLVFCAANFFRGLISGSGKNLALNPLLLKKIFPGVAVIAAYLLLAEDLGFYLSSATAFFALSLLYGERMNIRGATIVTICFLAVLYVMFSILLKVQVPVGLTGYIL